MSDTNRTELRYIVESATWGATPAAAPIDIRYTGESIKQSTNTVQSQEIRADRNIADLIRVGINGDGDLNVELSCPGNSGFWFDFLRGALMSAAWSATTTPTLGTELVVSGASGQIATLTRQAGDWGADLGVTPPITTFSGRFVKLAGFSGAATGNNQIVKILTVASATVCTALFTGTAPVNTSGSDDAGVTQTIGSYIRNGIAVPTPSASSNNCFTLEKKFQDLTTEYEYSKGAMVDRFSLNVAADQIATGSFGMLSKSVASNNTFIGSTDTPVAVSTAPVYSGVDNVQAVIENNATVITLTALTAQIQNNLRARLEIGTLGATSIGSGSVNATGTIAAYYSDASTATMDRYLNGTASALCVVFKDTTPNYWVVDFPRIKYTSGQRVAGGINSDVMLEMAFQALYGSATENYTVSFTKF